jgi:molybdopterin molybdotransferase
MRSIGEATLEVLAQSRRVAPARPRIDRVPLAAACGRVLATDLIAGCDLPPFTRSTVDGFAVRASDAAPDARLRIVGESAAGRPSDATLGRGEAVRIFTGAQLPDGADAVIMVERTREDGEHVVLEMGLRAMQNVSLRGEDLAKGAQALAAGKPLGSGALALLASLGASEVDVVARPRVAIVPTGSELVAIGEEPRPGQIRESNGLVLEALCRLAGAAPDLQPAVADDFELIAARTRAALAGADVLLLSGGSSVGDFDFTPQVLAAVGVAVHFDRVALKPGKPTLFGTVGDKLVFGLPGNPISAFVTFHLFVRPALAAFALRPLGPPPWIGGRLRGVAKRTAARDQALPARLFATEGGVEVEVIAWHGSGDVTCIADADALALIPAGDGALDDGARVLFTPLDAGRPFDFATSLRS